MHISSTDRFKNLLSLVSPIAAVLALVALPACEGAKGDPGDPGEAGPAGPAGSNGTDGTDGTDGASVVVDPNAPPIDKAFAGIGGVDALNALSTLRLTSDGTRWIFGEGYMPEEPAAKVSTFTVDISMDLGTTQGLRLDYMRHLDLLGFSEDRTFSEILRGDVGVIDGTEHLFGFPGGDMLSDRWASIRKQQMILNPHLLLKEVAADPTLVLDDTGVGYLDGSVHHLVVVNNPISPITLWVNRATGWIAKVSFVENEPLLRDVEVEAMFYGWDEAATTSAGLRFPSDVYIAVDGMIVHQERRSMIEANAAIDGTTFDFPATANPMHSADDAMRGEANHQFHQMFASIGIPLDGVQTNVVPVELSVGVWHLAGGSHNSLLIEQQNGLVLVDAPLEEARQEAILTWAAGQFPTKSVSHVVVTHHHSDHVGGIRTVAAAGATAVVSEVSAGLFRRVFQARSTVVPDALAMNGLQVPIMTVDAGGMMTLPDAQRPVNLHHISAGHAADMVIVHVPGAEVVFQSDLFNTGTPVQIPPPFMQNTMDLIAGIQMAGINTDPTMLRIAGGHGAGTNTLAEIEAALP